MAIACTACGTVLPGLSDPVRVSASRPAVQQQAPAPSYPLKPHGSPQTYYPPQATPGYANQQAAPAPYSAPPHSGYSAQPMAPPAPAGYSAQPMAPPSQGWGGARAHAEAETHTYDPAHHAGHAMQGHNGAQQAPPAAGQFGGPTMHQPAPYINAPQPSAHAGGGSLVGRVKLVVEQGKILGEQFLLSDRQVIIGRYDAGSGRCPDIDLTAQDPAYVHRQHARLEFSPNGTEITVYDMGGRNGSYVNNQLIARNGAATLHLGDKLRIGRVVLRLQTAPEIEKDPSKA